MKNFYIALSSIFVFLIFSCSEVEESPYKTVSIDVNSTGSERTWFMALSKDSADISSDSVPTFSSEERSVTDIEKEQILISDIFTSEDSIFLKKEPEEIIKKNENVIKSLMQENRSATNTVVTPTFDPDVTTGSSTTVYVAASDTKFSPYTATKMCEGTYCSIFYIDNCTAVNAETFSNKGLFEKLKEIFDDEIFPNITDILGSYSYTNSYWRNIIKCPSKINIVIADLYNDYYTTVKNNGNGTVGYFYYGDFLTSNENQNAIIYLDTYFLQKKAEVVYTTMAHEFNHMLNFINKTIKGGSKKLYHSTWYTEMLSSLADSMFENYLVEDIAEKDTIAYQRLPFFYAWHNLGFSNWRNSTKNYFSSGDFYISYGNVFAFGNFLAKNYGGFPLITEIATNSYVDEESIVQAVRKINSDKSSITFEDILKDFSCVLISDYCGDTTLPTLNKKVEYSEDIYLPAINKTYTSILNKYYDTRTKSYSSDDIGFYAITTGNSVPLGQYGFEIFGYTDKVISSVNATVNTEYDAIPYIVTGEQVSF